ncbi:hemin uptake protein HemP [Xanthobacter autotrophicus]|uniref:hemin uptake protein HemP n=1 Tax=Xanthobacter TaxID=279 RepID=UPI0024AB1E6B|nr:hemin uptake protein HemP [Xanthobacter autotrophicus]MDI4663282.1 hemin uptake protein HemP [Xanthobacter autotrophicus]
MSRHEHGGAGLFGVQVGEDGAVRGAQRACRTIPMTDTQLDSRDLFAAGRLVTITHGEHTYQLRLTAQNKLILTK